MNRFLVIAVLTLAACTPKPRPEAHWRRANDQAEPLERARPACKAYALEKTKNVTGQGLAARAGESGAGEGERLIYGFAGSLLTAPALCLECAPTDPTPSHRTSASGR